MSITSFPRRRESTIPIVIGIFLILSMGWLASPIYANTPSISLRLEVTPREITIGDIIDYRAIVTFSTHVAPVPLGMPDPFGNFELRDYLASPQTPLPNTKQTMTHFLKLTTFSTGTQTIPSIRINFTTADGEQVQAQTEEISIEVISLLDKFGDEGNLRPFRGPFQFKSYFWIWVGVAVLILAAILYALKRYSQAIKSPTSPVFSRPPKPPEQVAWDAINELEDSTLLTDGKVKEFYSRISTIIREYLELRYQFSALDRTTSELLGEFRRNQFKSELTSNLRTLLESGDLVKFAKFTPDEKTIEGDLNLLKQIVTMTTPQAAKPATPKEKIPV